MNVYKSMVLIPVALFILYSVANATKNYGDTKTEVQSIKDAYSIKYKQPMSKSGRKQLLVEASHQMQTLLVEKLMPPWYGTDWDYDGTSENPGKGTIACGYFVSTLLRDVGLNVHRIRLAQQASENIIKSLVSSKSIRRFSRKPLSRVLENIKEWGAGLYIVGLDDHVGFLSVQTNEVYFIHSSYDGVVKEIAQQSTKLVESKYRVFGKLNDEKVLVRWFSGEKIKTIGSVMN